MKQDYRNRYNNIDRQVANVIFANLKVTKPFHKVPGAA
jgi:hypothetical protein